MYFNFLYLVRFALWSKMWSILEKVPWAAEKKVYMRLLGGIFYGCLLHPLIWYSLALKSLCWWQQDTEVIHYYCIWIFMFSSVCFMKLVAPMFGAYKLTIIIRLFPSVIYSDLLLLCLANFDLKITLSCMTIGIPACFQFLLAWYITFHPFPFSLCMSLPVRLSIFR
jgi:hypothetical protein